MHIFKRTCEIDWLYQSFTAYQHQKGHTVPKQVMMISQSNRKKKCYIFTVWELHCLRTALCESIRYQAKSEQNVQQDMIPRVRHGEAALCTPRVPVRNKSDIDRVYRPLEQVRLPHPLDCHFHIMFLTGITKCVFPGEKGYGGWFVPYLSFLIRSYRSLTYN